MIIRMMDRKIYLIGKIERHMGHKRRGMRMKYRDVDSLGSRLEESAKEWVAVTDVGRTR
jgi:hypothetical protein